MPGHRRGRRGGDRPAPGHTEARTSGDEPVAQLPVPGTAAARGDADGTAHAQQHGAGVGGARHGVDRSAGPADDGGADDCFVDINVCIDARGDADALTAGG
ncbi:hypothetical protein AMK21_11685 [Streptomyces sp. CB00316]|nr:hypothetical protein AMK21_11685 [Streptomyces sp. CB00316]